MDFSTEEEREEQRRKHPQASLIPYSVWKKYFPSGFSEELCKLQQISDAKELLAIVRDFWLEKTRLEKRQLWLAIAFMHPKMHPSIFKELAEILEIDNPYFIELAFALRKRDKKVEFIHFRTKKERREHPVANLIPYCVWKEYFTSGLSEGLCKLQQISNVVALRAHVHDFWLEKTFHEKRQLWLAIAFMHPQHPKHFLQELAETLNIGDPYLIELAFASGKQDYIDLVFASKHPDYHKLLIEGDYPPEINPILLSIKYGHVILLHHFIRLFPYQKAQEIIAANDYSLFKYALSRGEVEVIRYLLGNFVPEETFQAIISTKEYKILECAAIDNNHSLLRLLCERYTPEQVHEMIAANNYEILAGAACKGNLKIVEFLLKAIPAEKVEKMIGGNDYSAFQYAARENHVDVMRELLAHVSLAKAQEMVAASNYAAFHHAVTFKHIEVQHLLLDFPSVFKHAESNLLEFRDCINTYINKRLNDLRDLKKATEQIVFCGFNVSPSEVEKLFHYARYLIIQNSLKHHENISFLISIPAFEERAHLSYNGNGPNELIRLAISINNQMAYESLIKIAKVREEAILQQYYRVEQNDGVDLRELAQQEESSMTCLTQGEKQRLENAMKHYHHLLIGKGSLKDERSMDRNILNPFKEELIKRYCENPAIFLREDGTSFQLPLKHEEFEELLHTFTKTEIDNAQKAYYQHPDHTVFRFLSTPNKWIDPDAISVNQLKWSAYVDFAMLIAMLYFAAIDPNIMPTDGFTLETRLSYFIQEIARIARTHNMQTRTVLDATGQPKTEEYDDMKGDNPCCPRGVPRRLLQAVPGHPLLKLLTEDLLEHLLIEFIKNHFQSQINSSNQAALLEELNACVEQEKTDFLHLKTLDITLEQQQEFIESLKNKYVKQFDLSLEEYVQKRFSLTEPGADHICHALKFSGTISLPSLLTKEIKLQEPHPIDLEEAETIPIIQLAGTISDSLLNPDEQFNSSSSRFFRAPISRSLLQEETSYREEMHHLT